MKQINFTASILGALTLLALAGCQKSEPTAPARDLELPMLTSDALTRRSAVTLELLGGSGDYTITSRNSDILTAEFSDAGRFGAIKVTAKTLGKTTIDVTDVRTQQTASFEMGVVPSYLAFRWTTHPGDPYVTIDDLEDKEEIEKQLAENPMIGPEQHFVLVDGPESTLLVYNSLKNYHNDQLAAQGTYTIEFEQPAYITFHYTINGASRTVRLLSVDSILPQILANFFRYDKTPLTEAQAVAKTRYSPPYMPALLEDRTADFIGQHPDLKSCTIYHRVFIGTPAYSPIMKNF